MDLFLRRHFVSVIAVLLVCVSAHASPTAGEAPHHSFAEADISAVSTLKTCPDCGSFTDLSNSTLAEIGSEIFKPSPDYPDFNSTDQVQAKSLPAVPAAVLMSIIGFLCVSLVNDRKIWLSVFVGIILLSQAGIQTLPRLTARLAQGRFAGTHSGADVAVNSIHIDSSFNWFSDQPDRHYIGLLHRLAASPDDDRFFPDIFNRGQRISDKLDGMLSDVFSISARRDITSPQPAFIPVQCTFNPLTGNLAERVISFVCFSPAFIFKNQARGPPIMVCKFFQVFYRACSRNALLTLVHLGKIQRKILGKIKEKYYEKVNYNNSIHWVNGCLCFGSPNASDWVSGI